MNSNTVERNISARYKHWIATEFDNLRHGRTISAPDTLHSDLTLYIQTQVQHPKRRHFYFFMLLHWRRG